MDASLVRYLEVLQRPLALVEGERVLWANAALSDLLATAQEDLVGTTLPIAGGLNLDRIRRSSTEVALRHATGYLLDVVITTTSVSPTTWMLEFAIADYEDHKSADYFRKLQVLADNLPIGILISEHGLRLGYVNTALAAILGVIPTDLLGMGWLELFGREDRDLIRGLALTALTGVPVRTTLSVSSRHAGERTLDIALIPVTSRDASVSFIGTVQDITEQVANEARLTFAVDHDALTGLANRRRLESDIAERLAKLATGELRSSMIGFCDIDHFKVINDTLGHLAGDRVLTEVANRLREAGLAAYRFAGDEFVVLIDDDDRPLEELERMLSTTISNAIAVGSALLSVNTSVGVTAIDPHDSASEVIRKADRAMYDRKQMRVS
ncbi:MAG: diguanylate cyclase domain-containing protein [Ferrimicrobium sp.]|jgi:diguanylate cyclase (GGDEF)-like protein/PAS domain S-box-containing protein|uniref:Diguanylate cyclase n=1 Tax=Ferrimicrobium acidiphilum TaxID=121039 RepID=A0ABV3XYJ7_9ACTN|nr:sensor domain-containing diguanylate cyclase [Ferrimicrobium sp.]